MMKMYAGNQSTVSEFILLGLSDDPFIQILLFPIFLVIYMATVAGNLLLITAVRTDRRLHTSMYTFLSTLSLLDITYTSSIVPKVLMNLISSNKTISFPGCATQFFFFLYMGETECLLLALMAYDRYVAICNPLHYTMIMNRKVCLWMICTSWMTGFIISSLETYFVVSLTFCGPNTINHFICEIPSLMQLACSDITSIYISNMVAVIIFLYIPVSLIFISYLRIVATIMTISVGKSKAFSTCISHLVVVALFFGSIIFMYGRTELSVTENVDKIVSVFYSMITPMLNPLIYSLRNKDVHRAVKRLMEAK